MESNKKHSGSSKNISPHDRYFRRTMSDPRVAKEFFEQHLPEKIKSAINLDGVRLQKDSFIGDNLKQQIADLLFSVEFNGKPGYLYLLLEHQSTPEELMPFRMHKYMFAIMESHMRKTNKKELPVVYPLIFYSGKRSYNHSTDLFDLFGDHKEIAKSILYKPCQLIDLSKMSDEKLKESLLYGVLGRVMKHAYEKEVIDFLREVMHDLGHIADIKGIDYIYGTLSYIVEAYDMSKDEFAEVVRENLPIINEKKIMTIAEQYREEGYQKGLTVAEQYRQEGYQKGLTVAEQYRQEGYQKGLTVAEQYRQEGLEKGKNQAMKLIVKKLFDQGMSIDQIVAVTSLPLDEIKTLKRRSSN